MPKPDLFLLDPESNQDFVAGRGPRKHLSKRTVLLRTAVAAALFNAVALGGQAWAFWSRWPQLGDTSKREAIGALVITLVLNLVLRAISRVFLRRAEQQTQLTQQGQIIEGRVTSCAAKYDGAFMVELGYGFQAPDGRKLKGSRTHLRPDLQNATLPTPGAPVAVLYADDSLHQVL